MMNQTISADPNCKALLMKIKEGLRQHPMDPKIFCEFPEQLVSKISMTGENKSSQIRKFYEEIERWTHKEESQFEIYKPYMKMLAAKARYAEEKKVISSEFCQLVNVLVDVATEKFENIFKVKDFMECIIAYSYQNNNK